MVIIIIEKIQTPTQIKNMRTVCIGKVRTNNRINVIKK